MTVRCGGKCGNPDCAFEGATHDHVWGHVGATRRYRLKPGLGVGPKAAMKGPGSPPPKGPEPSPFYAPLKDLPWGKEPPKPTPAQVSVAPPGPLFDSTPWWLNLGKLIDDTLLADKKVKIGMTEASARRLDASLQAAGWRVEANPNPVSLPYWLPFAVTIVGAFALPVAAAYVPDLLKKARERAEAARKAALAKAVPVTKRPGVTAQAPAAVPETDIEAEIAMTAAAPPFNLNPMPWREPGER